MPGWNEIEALIDKTTSNDTQNGADIARHYYLKQLAEITGRNIITYYSGWLHPNKNALASLISGMDVTNFMAMTENLDAKRGLDLILHTNGGHLAATEFIIEYLHNMFSGNIRAIIPLRAMSAGAIIALSCNEIVMGDQSSLGPIDPHIRGVSCKAVLEEFDRAEKSVGKDPASGELWRAIISKYEPGFLDECKQFVDFSSNLLVHWLSKNMCKGDQKRMWNIINALNDRTITKTHERYIPKSLCKKIGINIVDMESDRKLRGILVPLHYCYVLTFMRTPALKIVENHLGTKIIQT